MGDPRHKSLRVPTSEPVSTPHPHPLCCWLLFQPPLRGPQGGLELSELARGHSPEQLCWGKLEIRLPQSERGQLEAASCQLAEEGGGEQEVVWPGTCPAPHVTGATGIYSLKPLDAPVEVLSHRGGGAPPVLDRWKDVNNSKGRLSWRKEPGPAPEAQECQPSPQLTWAPHPCHGIRSSPPTRREGALQRPS